MSTDRELLEQAAKAAGIELLCAMPVGRDDVQYVLADRKTIWSPLTDDGDALRLAVKLRQMRVHIDVESTAAFRNDVHGMPAEFCGEPHGTDPYAATRRAIVSAAAQIGSQQ